MTKEKNETPNNPDTETQASASSSNGTPEDFDEKLRKAGEEVFKAREAGKGRTAAAKELDALKAELADANDRALRAMAELENFRVRKNRELADEQKYSSMKLAREILPIWDNLGRALEAAPADEAMKGFIDGVKMVHQQFVDVLAKNGVTRIPAEGEIFDPNVHASIAMLPSDKPAGTVIVDSLPGFILYDRVVRPAQVVVSAPKPGKTEDAPEESAEKTTEE